ncbi:Coenzyme F420 hydrogenase/dehydrogenase, beta subunit C-terminal domain [uncultured Ruminococcus sp.]|uniref:Coenzyme F420 hydrogenase/dehydrogenase, beta subunit C-terminal domain n=1 Tax=uncultured Ruminococcus sp. TaxID=165186 RepID=UPI002636A78A|nr:Coenzyme F420 hydrogenase/dehydrogenase, beta subunit C-terminal domain [uncultured Ruminococcus sp.]
MILQEVLFQDRSECCGCSACVDICPKSVLIMQEDASGFLYPRIKEHAECIDCKRCLKVCPEKNLLQIDSEFKSFYAGYFKDNKELISCASGGLATAISKKFIQSHGIVYGCAYSDDWNTIEYKRVTDILDLEKLKTSKYSQSIKEGIYKKVIADLQGGSKVLFIGLPCDVLAVKSIVPTKYHSALYLLELICHGPTSLKVHRQFITELEKKGRMIFFSTRAKKNGAWKPFYIHAKYENGTEHYEEFHKSAYGAAFRYMKRPSCYTCKIKGNHLVGDLMIGDYHYVEKGMNGYNEHGVSSALVHNEKGEQLLAELDSVGFYIIEIPRRNAIGNGAITRAIPAPAKHEEFEKFFVEKGLISASRLRFVIKSNIERSIKASMLKFAVKVKRFFLPSTRPHD